MTPTTLWLIAGIGFLLLEAFGMSGIGLMFAGLGALVTGTLVEFGVLAQDAHVAQFIVFFAATALLAVLLWKPLKRFRLPRSGGYSNMVGDTAYIGAGGLAKGRVGEATWSGTIMKAELAADASVEQLDAGAQAVIVDVQGAKLIVKPK